MVNITNAKKLARADIFQLPWADAYFREMDLVIAAGELDSMVNGTTLYDAVLGARVADFCSPLDRGCEPNFDKLIVLPSADFQSEQLQSIGQNLAAKPRGTWQVWQAPDGGYDIWMATGTGTIATPSGYKFSHKRFPGPELDFRTGYAAVLGTIIYERRSQIRNAIVRASVDNAGIEPGTHFRDVMLNGQKWTNATYLGIDAAHFVGDINAYTFICSRRGKKSQFKLETSAFMRIVGAKPIMPAEFEDRCNDERLASLEERRALAAQAQWPALAVSIPFDTKIGSAARFTVDGDLWTRDVFRPDHSKAGTIEIAFKSDSDVPFASQYRPSII